MPNLEPVIGCIVMITAKEWPECGECGVVCGTLEGCNPPVYVVSGPTGGARVLWTLAVHAEKFRRLEFDHATYIADREAARMEAAKAAGIVEGLAAAMDSHVARLDEFANDCGGAGLPDLAAGMRVRASRMREEVAYARAAVENIGR